MQARMINAVAVQFSPAMEPIEAGTDMDVEPTPQQLVDAIHSLNDVMHESCANLVFNLFTAHHSTLVNMTDVKTGNEITQYPAHAILAIANTMRQLQQLS